MKSERLALVVLLILFMLEGQSLPALLCALGLFLSRFYITPTGSTSKPCH